MDRSIIGPWRAEEKDLNSKLYRKLQGLTLLHPATEEFRRHVTEEAFLKCNQQAFFQVMHFLFCLLDPMEFKKRFYWPISDKRSEASFRTATVDYLKHLNDKYQLQWSIKPYLVVMPGGKKFIMFLLDLVRFVIKELTRRKEKEVAGEVDVSELNLRRMRRQNQFYKEFASEYLSEIDTQMDILREKKELIRKELKMISEKSGVAVEDLLAEDFGKNLQRENEDLFRKKYTKCTANLYALEEPFIDLKSKIEYFLSKEAEVRSGKEKVSQTLEAIHKLLQEEADAERDCDTRRLDGAMSKMEELMMAFNQILPIVTEQLDLVDQKPGYSEFVKTELISVRAELKQIELQITDFQKKLNAKIKKRNTKCIDGIRQGQSLVNHEIEENVKRSLSMKFISTPPIKLEMLERARNANARLPLLDDFIARGGLDSFNSLLVPRSVSKPKQTSDSSIVFNTTLNRSRIIDPIQLLQTIKKDTLKVRNIPLGDQNLSGIGAMEWKERQCLFKNDMDLMPQTSEPTLRTDVTTLKEPECSSFQSTAAAKLTATTPRTPCLETGITTTLLYTKKVSAVKKVKDDSLNIANMSTSPSGRLDPLVEIDVKHTPKLQLNDKTLNDETIVRKRDDSRDVLQEYLNTPMQISITRNRCDIVESVDNVENDANVANVSNVAWMKTGFDLNVSSTFGDEEAIFNTSDSVLKDVFL